MNWIPPLTYLSQQEWRELLALEYVLTWGYSDNPNRDEKKHRELSDKRWGVWYIRLLKNEINNIESSDNL